MQCTFSSWMKVRQPIVLTSRHRDHPTNRIQPASKRPLPPEYPHTRHTQAPSSNSVPTASSAQSPPTKKRGCERERSPGTHLQTLRRGTLQQIIQSPDHDHAFQPTVYLYPTDDPPVLTLYVSERRHAFLCAYEALAGVVRCVERGDVARAERRCGQREREGAEDAAEEWGDGRDEGKLHAWLRGRGSGEVGGSWEEFREVPSRLAFVNMVRERVWTNTASEALGRHFG